MRISSFGKIEPFLRIPCVEFFDPALLSGVRLLKSLMLPKDLVREGIFSIFADCVLEVRATIAGTLCLGTVLVPTVHHRVFRQANVAAA